MYPINDCSISPISSPARGAKMNISWNLSAFYNNMYEFMLVAVHPLAGDVAEKIYAVMSVHGSFIGALNTMH